MQKRSVQIILIVSLSFNLAFIGFGVFRYFQMRRFSDPRTLFRHAPQKIKDSFREHRETIDPIREEIDTMRDQFVAELRNPDFDGARIQEKLDQYLAKQNELERVMGNNFIELRKNLTPEQAEKFFSRLPGSQHRDPPNRMDHPNTRKPHEKPE